MEEPLEAMLVAIGNPELSPEPSAELWFSWLYPPMETLLWLSCPKPKKEKDWEVWKIFFVFMYLLEVIPHLVSALENIPVEHRPSLMAPKGGSPWEGNSAPGVRKTFVVFFLFFHFALLFWNQTC